MLLTINPPKILKWLTCFFRDQLHCQDLDITVKDRMFKNIEVQKCREAIFFRELQVFVSYVYVRDGGGHPLGARYFRLLMTSYHS